MAYVRNIVKRYQEVYTAGIQRAKVGDEAEMPRVPMRDHKH